MLRCGYWRGLLRAVAARDALAQAFRLALGQPVEHPAVAAVSQRNDPKGHVRGLAQLLQTRPADRRPGKRAFLVTEPIGTAVQAAMAVFHGAAVYHAHRAA